MKVRDRSFGSIAFDTVNFLFMFAIILATLYPMYYIAIVSFSNGREVLNGNVHFLPRGINLETYKMVLKDASIVR